MSNMDIKLKSEQLKKVPSYRYLGVVFDSSLSYSEQVNIITSKTKRGIGALSGTIRKWAPRNILCCAIRTIALPALLYGIETWYPPDDWGRRKIEKIQKYAARLVLNNFKHDAEYEDLLNQLNWCTIQEMVTERRLTNLFKYRKGFKFIPEELFPPEDLTGTRKSSRLNKAKHSKILKQSTARNSREEKMCVQQTISTWNALAENMVNESSLGSFQTRFRRDKVYSKLCMEGSIKHVNV
jgi:hypothetical protein